jgi:hypothetical protein
MSGLLDPPSGTGGSSASTRPSSGGWSETIRSGHAANAVKFSLSSRLRASCESWKAAKAVGLFREEAPQNCKDIHLTRAWAGKSNAAAPANHRVTSMPCQFFTGDDFH